MQQASGRIRRQRRAEKPGPDLDQALKTPNRDRGSTPVLVGMLAVGLLYCYLWTLDQGDTKWEDSDKGWVLGWVTHFVVIGGLLLVLWWWRARWWVMIAAPVITGLVAFAVTPPGGWIDEDADFSDTSTIADGFNDVFPHTLTAAVGMAFVVMIVLLVTWSRAPQGDAPRRETDSSV